MIQPGNATLVNSIIDKNKDTIMENFQKDNVGAFNFGKPTPLLDLMHLLFRKLPPPISLDDPNHPLYIPQEEPKLIMSKPMDPNIPSTQLGAPLPPNHQATITQSLIHTTPDQPILTQTMLPFTPFVVASSQLASLLSFPPQTISQIGSPTPSMSISGAFGESQTHLQAMPQFTIGMPLTRPSDQSFTILSAFAYAQSTIS